MKKKTILLIGIGLMCFGQQQLWGSSRYVGGTSTKDGSDIRALVQEVRGVHTALLNLQSKGQQLVDQVGVLEQKVIELEQKVADLGSEFGSGYPPTARHQQRRESTHSSKVHSQRTRQVGYTPAGSAHTEKMRRICSSSSNSQEVMPVQWAKRLFSCVTPSEAQKTYNKLKKNCSENPKAVEIFYNLASDNWHAYEKGFTLDNTAALIEITYASFQVTGEEEALIAACGFWMKEAYKVAKKHGCRKTFCEFSPVLAVRWAGSGLSKSARNYVENNLKK